jgi:DNA-binding transcriptional LysR family regulator
VIGLNKGVYKEGLMIRSLELMASFHEMCECDTWSEISRVTGKSRRDVEEAVSELECLVGKKLIYRDALGSVASQFSSRFFMPTDAGMRWYLLIGEMLKGLDGASPFSSLSKELIDSLLNDLSLGRRAVVAQQSLNLPIIIFSFFETMQNLKIFTNDFLSFYFLEPILAKLLSKNQSPLFSSFGYESEHLNEFDAYLLHYEFPKKDFCTEVVTEGKLGLYAHPSYLDRSGIPQTLTDLAGHTFIRCKSMHTTYALGVKKFKAIPDYPLMSSYKERCLEVDSVSSLRKLADLGAGIVSVTDTGAKNAGIELQRIPPLREEDHFIYRKYIFGYHQKYQNAPLIRDIALELHSIFN